MPLIELYERQNDCYIGIWKTTESETELSEMFESLAISQPLKLPKLIKHRTEFYSTHLLLNDICNKNGQKFIGIIKNAHGKPFLDGIDAHISYTHSQNYVAAIFSFTKTVGIDIEAESSKLEIIKTKFLNQAEQLKFVSVSELCQVWTAKEAAYKLNGKKGISLRNDIKINNAQTIEIENQILDWIYFKIEENMWLSYVID